MHKGGIAHHKHRHTPHQRFAKPLCLFLAGLAILIPLVSVGSYRSRSALPTRGYHGASLYPTYNPRWHTLPTPFTLDTSNLVTNNESVTVPLGELRARLKGLQSSYNCSEGPPGRRPDYAVCKYAVCL